MLQYKGYRGIVELDEEAGIFHGEVVGTRDVITFEGSSVQELEAAFRDSVDDYLDFCSERGEEPDKPFSGKLMVRLDPDLHRSLYLQAKVEKKSLNQLIIENLEDVGKHFESRKPGFFTAEDAEMKEEYDFSKMKGRRNRYAKELKRGSGQRRRLGVNRGRMTVRGDIVQATSEEDWEVLEERESEPNIPLEEVVRDLKKRGKI